MDGVHDMGGMHGFGKVEPEQNEPVFHDDWERRLYALYRAMSYAGVWVIDQARFARERLPPAVYLASSYYRKWELGMEKLLAELGLVGPDELAAGHALRPGKALKRKLAARRAQYRHARLVLTGAAGTGAVQAGRSDTHQEHSSDDAYTPAALCARPHRRDRGRARLP